MASEENIKIAVRLRPFVPNVKEEAEGKVKRIIRMDELSSTVSVTNPDNRLDIQKFTFDNILWSFDGYSEQADGYLAPENKAVSEEIYCDQKQVYDEVGKEMVQNLWNGYNSTIFTFGESKSGKSWTLLGLGANKGIVPQALTDIFKGVRDKEKTSQQNGSTIEVRFSMAEIYNDKIKDLLPATTSSSTSNSIKFKNNLKIREHSKKGFYIEGLRNILAVNHEDIQQRLEEGLINRAMFLTSVNGTAENSMTIIYVTLVQKIRNHRGDEVTRVASLEFMDLPSCEFNRLNNITNKEIEAPVGYPPVCSPFLKRNGVDCLVSCVNSILEVSIGKHNNDIIPFHGHSLTKLLKNALVGNAKTFMVVTLNPSEQAYQRSLFILKFAEKVRLLTTHAVINEEVTSKLIRELKSENEKLRKLISLGDFETNDLSTRLEGLVLGSPSSRDAMKRKIMDDMKGQIRENDKEIRNLQQPLDERIKQFKMEKNDIGKKIDNDRKSKCHVFNLNSDSQITGKIILIIPLGTIDFGHLTNGKGKESNHFLSFCGPGIQDHHGTFTYNSKDGKFSIKPAGPNCKVLVNETPVQFDTILGSNDRIILGASQVWVFQNPKEAWLEKYAFPYKFYFEDIMEETAVKSEYYKKLNRDGSLDDCHKKQLLHLLPSIADATSIAEDLNQNFMLHPVLQHPVEFLINGASISGDEKTTSYSDMITEVDEESDYGARNHPNILVKAQNLVDGTFYYWSIAKFYDRLEMLKGSCMQFLEDGDVPLKEVEAFKEPTDLDVPIGYSIICLKPLGYLMNIENSSVPILDYITYQSIGTVNVSLCLCDDSGEKLNDLEVFVENPDELLDQTVILLMNIQNLQTISYQFKEIYCKYKFLDEDEEVTKFLDTKTSSFITGSGNKYERRISVGPITDNILNLILTQCLVLRFFGKQRAHKLLNLVGNLQNESIQYDRGKFPNPVELELAMTQLKIKEKAEQRHQRRLNAFKALVEQSEEMGEDSIPVSVMKTLFEAKSQNLVNQSLDEHKELLTPIPDEQEHLPPELKALKRFSEICSIF